MKQYRQGYGEQINDFTLIEYGFSHNFDIFTKKLSHKDYFIASLEVNLNFTDGKFFIETITIERNDSGEIKSKDTSSIPLKINSIEELRTIIQVFSRTT